MNDGEHIFVPVCKNLKNQMFVFGPLGYVEVDRVTECPIIVKSELDDEQEETVDGR